MSMTLWVAKQITPSDVATLSAQGFRSIICNRPDGEGADQPLFVEIDRAAEAAGLATRYLPVTSGKVRDEDAARFAAALIELPKPILAYCRTGTRSTTLWGLSQAQRRPVKEIVEIDARCGLRPCRRCQQDQQPRHEPDEPHATHDIVIVGGGAAGAAVAASLLRRKSDLDIAVIEPAENHYYQPGWTMVGGGIFEPRHTVRPMGAILPRSATWIKAAVAGFRAGRQHCGDRGLPCHPLQSTRRLSRHQARLGCHRRPSGNAWPQWHHLQLSI